MIKSVLNNSSNMKLFLIDSKNLEDDIYLFTFKPEKILMWTSGQQMVFTIASKHADSLGISRTLSIASAPFEKNILVLTHCSNQSSTFKTDLKNLKPGDSIEASEPFGDFVLTDSSKHHTLIASGVGIAPYRAMLLELDYHNLPLDCMLFYSHITEHFPFKALLDELVERHSNFSVYYTIDPKEIERGRIKEVVVGLADEPIYMSGIYIRKIATMLDHRDVKPKHLVHDGETSGQSPRQLIIQKEEKYLASMWGE